MTEEQLRPVVDAVSGAGDLEVRIDAFGALIGLRPEPEQWRSMAPAVIDLIDDVSRAGGVGLQRVAELSVSVPLQSVRDRLRVLATDGPPAVRQVVLTELAAVGDSDAVPDLITSLVAGLRDGFSDDDLGAAAAQLARLPIERHGVRVRDLQPALDRDMFDVRFWAALAAARLGHVAPLSAVLSALAAGNAPNFMSGDPWTAYDAIAAVRPVPEPVRSLVARHLDGPPRSIRDRLLRRPKRKMDEMPRDYRLFVWAVTGAADAEGTRLDAQAEGPASAPGPVPAEPTPPGGDPSSTTTSNTAHAARLLESLVESWVQADDGMARTVAGNDVVQFAAALPSPLPLDLERILRAYETGRPIAEDQLGWLLAHSLGGELFPAFDAQLQHVDTKRRNLATHLLWISLEQAERDMPLHGAGPATAAPKRAPAELIDDVPQTAGAVSAGDEPPSAVSPPGPVQPPAPAPSARPPAAATAQPQSLPPVAVEPQRSKRRPRVAPRREAPPPAAARRPPAAPPAAATEVRRLQGEVTESAAGRRRSHTFAPGTDHVIGVHIGPGGSGKLVVSTPLNERNIEFQPFGAPLRIELVHPTPEGTASQQQPLLLPSSGPSAQARFTVPVARDAREFRCSILVFQDAVLLQSAQLRGPVATVDAPVDGQSMRFVQDADLVSVPGGMTRSDVGASLSFHVGQPGEALLVDEHGNDRIVQVGSLATFRESLVSLLRAALDADAAGGTAPGSPQQVELLRTLARRGNTLYQALQPQLAGITLDRTLQMISAEDDVVPLELVYDYGLPGENAGLTRHWRRALKTGRCRCKPKEGKVRSVCPLGFWGLRLTIERQLAATGGRSGEADPAGTPRPGHDRLPPLNRVMFAAASEVDAVNKHERQETLELLNRRLGDRVVAATSWRSWKTALASHKPGMLLALPHTGEAADGLPTIVIGDGSELEVGAVTTDYVVPPGSRVGPVVLLLGCSTANAEVPWQSAAAAFRRRGASVVVGTLVETLGRQTAPMARLLADLLWGEDPVREPTVGAVMQTVRRRLVASGATLGMSLVAFGHSDWLVSRDGT